MPEKLEKIPLEDYANTIERRLRSLAERGSLVRGRTPRIRGDCEGVEAHGIERTISDGRKAGVSRHALNSHHHPVPFNGGQFGPRQWLVQDLAESRALLG